MAADTVGEKDAWLKRLSLNAAADQTVRDVTTCVGYNQIDGTLDGDAGKVGVDDDASGDEAVPVEGYMVRRDTSSSSCDSGSVVLHLVSIRRSGGHIDSLSLRMAN